MEKSTKFSFNLPSRDSDDIADINQISDNFRKIDNEVQEKLESGKNLKTINNQSLLGSGNIEIQGGLGEADQTYSPTSPNAQSGLAVAEAVKNKIGFVEKRGLNLLDESTAVKGAYWDDLSGNITSNQYTGNYIAYEFDTNGASSVVIAETYDMNFATPRFYNYWFIYADGTKEKVNKESYAPTNVIENIPENVVKIRFSLNTGGGTIYTVMVNEGTTALPYEPYHEPILKIEYVTDELNKIYNAISPRIVIGGSLFAVIGDTIQVFYDAIIDGDRGNLGIMFECAKGKNYPRYWEYTPANGESGEYPITIKLLSHKGDVYDEKSCVLHVAEALNPSQKVNVLCVGDSTMENGQIPIEASRRVKGTVGVATNPKALNLSNINFVGRKTNADGSVGWEGTGGWTYGSYNISGYTSIRFTVSGANDLNIGAVYQVGNFKLVINEINVTNGNGNIRCLFYFATPYTSAFDALNQSGSLTLVSGGGQASVTYSAWKKETYQPFWNATTNKWDILTYRDTYCGGQIDIVCILLGINTVISKTQFTEFSVADAQALCRNIHSQLPNCKIVISTLPSISPNGGIASNYGASSSMGAYSFDLKNHMVHDFNRELIEMAESDEFSSYVIISNSHAQFDAKYGYPTTTKKVNTRSDETETVQSNGVHPNNTGYWQLADAMAFRTCLCVVSE